MRKTWVIVADSARARIFSVTTPKGPLTELEDLVHPASRAHERDLRSDRSGRGTAKSGTMGSPNSAKAHEVHEFAGDLADRLETARVKGDYEQLVLVGAPDFLGNVRKRLPDGVSKCVYKEIDKNLTQLSVKAIRGHLPEFL